MAILKRLLEARAITLTDFKMLSKISLDYLKMANEEIVSSIEKLEQLKYKYENMIHIVSETADIRQKLETLIKLDPSKNYKVAIKYCACYNLIDK